MSYCVNCGVELSDGAASCPLCGTPAWKPDREALPYFPTKPAVVPPASRRAAALLLTTDDFTSFAKLHSDARTNICRVSEARWETWRNSFGVPGAVFTISADRFLRNMVRAIVGTLVEVGRHKISVEEFCQIIEKKDRCSAGTSMPGNALFLWEVTYPFHTE